MSKKGKQEKGISPALLLTLLVGSFLIKAAYLVFSQKSPFYEPLLLDPAYYHEWALRIIKERGMGHEVFYGLPLYPIFLALCYKFFSGSLLAVKIVQILLGTVTIFFIYKIGEKIAGQRVGFIAALLASFYGPLFFHETILIAEALSMPLYAVSFYLSLCFIEEQTLKKGILLGVFFGLAALTKAGILIFVFLFLAVLFIKQIRQKKGSALAIIGCLGAFLLTLAPVTAHNFIAGKDHVLLTSHGGFNFYVGNNPEAEGVFQAPQGIGRNVEAQIEDSKAVAEKDLGRSLKPSEVSKYWEGRAWAFIRENPGSFLKLSFKKALLFFDAREISDIEDYEFSKNFNPYLKFPWLTFAIIGPFVLLGLAAPSKVLKHRFFILLWIASYLAGVILFFVNARYRLPMLGVFFPLAAVGALQFYQAAREKAWARIIFFIFILAAGILVTQLRLVGNDWIRDWVNVADIYQKNKNYEKAEEIYKKALEINPKWPKANLGMGVTLTKQGRWEDAKEYYLRTLEGEPQNYEALNSLGLWYDRKGSLETAKNYFLKALEVKPESSQVHNNLGMVYGKMGDNERAVEEFQISLKINPRSAKALTNLGLIYYRLGNVKEAKAHWDKALEVDPDSEEARRALKILEGKAVFV